MKVKEVVFINFGFFGKMTMEGNYDVTAINHLTVQHESTSVTRCWNKKLPNLFCKCCPKSSHCSFHLKSNVSEMDQKVAQYLRDFSKKICYQDFSKKPNLVTHNMAERKMGNWCASRRIKDKKCRAQNPYNLIKTERQKSPINEHLSNVIRLWYPTKLTILSVTRRVLWLYSILNDCFCNQR